MRSLVKWDLLLAQALCLQGDQRAAQRTLREAISKASSSRLVRSFVDEGPMIHTLLAGIYEGDLEVLHPSDAFAAEVLEIFARNGKGAGHTRRPAREAAPAALFGKLTSKECEILGLVSSGLRNREVAQKLGMTEGSVKWYMQQVYDKVGTRRRLQAVERARQFGSHCLTFPEHSAVAETPMDEPESARRASVACMNTHNAAVPFNHWLGAEVLSADGGGGAHAHPLARGIRRSPRHDPWRNARRNRRSRRLHGAHGRERQWRPHDRHASGLSPQHGERPTLRRPAR